MAQKIFIYEHDDTLLEVVSYILSSSGYDVHGCNLEDCVPREIEHYKPDAILLDVVMVNTRGTQLCRLLDELPHTRHIPIIAFSTNRQSQQLKDICADDVVDKPFDVNRLLQSVAEQLDKHKKTGH